MSDLDAEVRAYAAQYDLTEEDARTKLIGLGLVAAKSHKPQDLRVARAYDNGVKMGAILITAFSRRLTSVYDDVDEAPETPTPTRDLGNGRVISLVTGAG